MGRPKLARGEQKWIMVSFRVNAAERRALIAAAKAAKVSLATWLAQIVAEAVREKLTS